MNGISQELIEIADALPMEKARELVDFAHFLKQQAGDLEWERIIAGKRSRPKLEVFVAEALREGKSELLDTNKL